MGCWCSEMGVWGIGVLGLAGVVERCWVDMNTPLMIMKTNEEIFNNHSFI